MNSSNSTTNARVEAEKAPHLKGPSAEVVADFRRRIEFLHRVVNSDEFVRFSLQIPFALLAKSFKTKNPFVQRTALKAKLQVAAAAPPVPTLVEDITIKKWIQVESRRQLGLEELPEVSTGPAEASEPVRDGSQRSSSSNSQSSLQILNRTSDSGPRTPKKLGGAEPSALLDHHRKLQEEYTDDMLEFTGKLKENAIATSKVVASQLTSLGTVATPASKIAVSKHHTIF